MHYKQSVIVHDRADRGPYCAHINPHPKLGRHRTFLKTVTPLIEAALVMLRVRLVDLGIITRNLGQTPQGAVFKIQKSKSSGERRLLLRFGDTYRVQVVRIYPMLPSQCEEIRDALLGVVKKHAMQPTSAVEPDDGRKAGGAPNRRPRQETAGLNSQQKKRFIRLAHPILRAAIQLPGVHKLQLHKQLHIGRRLKLGVSIRVEEKRGQSWIRIGIANASTLQIIHVHVRSPSHAEAVQEKLMKTAQQVGIPLI